MTQEYKLYQFRDLIQDKVAEPDSDEGQEEIHADQTHVAEMWEDGEITVTKCGDLYGRRNLHQSSPPLLPGNNTLWDVPDGKDHKRMVIVDDDLRDIIRNATVKTTTSGITIEVDR